MALLLKIPNPATLPTGNATGAAYSPDGSLLAITHGTSPRVTIYNTADWSKVPNPPVLPTGNGQKCAFSPDGSLLAVAHATSPFITIYNTADWSKVPNPSVLPANQGQGVRFSPDGSLLAVAHFGAPNITIYNTSDWSKVPNPAVLPAGTGAYGPSFSPDGSLLAVGSTSSPFVTIYNTADWGKVPNPASLPPGIVFSTDFSPDGSRLVVGHDVSPYLKIYDTSDWSVASAPSPTYMSGAGNVDYSPDGAYLAAVFGGTYGGDFLHLTVHEVSGWVRLAHPDVPVPQGSGNAVAFNPSTTQLAVAHSNTPFVSVYDIQSSSPQTGDAQGFSSTNFGTPASDRFDAFGASHAQFGTPLYFIPGQTGLQQITVPSTKFGTPLRLFWDQALQATSLPQPSFGAAWGYSVTTPLTNQICKVLGAKLVSLGAPAAIYDQVATAAHTSTTVFGRPNLARNYAAGFSSVRLGIPFATFDQLGAASPLRSTRFSAYTGVFDQTALAAGAQRTKFGTPAEPLFRAASINRTRFGTPKYAASGAGATFGFRSTWFGHPRAASGVLCNTAGGQNTAFGTAELHQAYRVLHIPPTARFGTPLLQRAPTC